MALSDDCLFLILVLVLPFSFSFSVLVGNLRSRIRTFTYPPKGPPTTSEMSDSEVLSASLCRKSNGPAYRLYQSRQNRRIASRPDLTTATRPSLPTKPHTPTHTPSSPTDTQQPPPHQHNHSQTPPTPTTQTFSLPTPVWSTAFVWFARGYVPTLPLNNTCYTVFWRVWFSCLFGVWFIPWFLRVLRPLLP